LGVYKESGIVGRGGHSLRIRRRVGWCVGGVPSWKPIVYNQTTNWDLRDHVRWVGVNQPRPAWDWV